MQIPLSSPSAYMQLLSVKNWPRSLNVQHVARAEPTSAAQQVAATFADRAAAVPASALPAAEPTRNHADERRAGGVPNRSILVPADWRWRLMQWMVPAIALWCIADAYLGINGVKVTLTSLLGLLLVVGWSIANLFRSHSPERALLIADSALFCAAAILVGQLCYAATRADAALLQLAIQDLVIWAPLASGLSAFAYARRSWVPIAVTAGTYSALSIGALHLGGRQDASFQLPPHGLVIQALGILAMGIFFNRLRETVSLTIARLRLAEEQSHVDTLTGLFNRRKFDLDWTRAVQEHPGACLVLVDIDHFKKINDQHGHAAGDRVLALVGQCLSAAVLGKGAAYRWGGEEFALIVNGGRLHGRLLAQRVMAEVNSMKPFPDHPLSVSAGLACMRPGQSPAAVFQQADEALLEAKRAGRNRLICGAVEPLPASMNPLGAAPSGTWPATAVSAPPSPPAHPRAST